MIPHQFKPFTVTLIFLFCTFIGKTQGNYVLNYDSLTIYSNHLKENRRINIWKPKDYANSSDSLPLLVMLDGGIQEDFVHFSSTIDSLVSCGKIPPIILVGIENTQRRRDLTGPTSNARDKTIAPIVGESEKFRTFLTKEMLPQIKQTYRTNETHGIVGESLAGLFVMETFLTKSEDFDFFIAFDPSLWWNNAFLVKEVKHYFEKMSQTNKTLWFAGSNAKDIHANCIKLSKIIRKINPSYLKWNFLNCPKETHRTIFKATKVEALIWTFTNIQTN